MARNDRAEDRWRRKLARELAREQLRRARQAVRDARGAKRQARSRADQACRDARAQLKEWSSAERERVRAEIARLRAALKQDLAARRERVRECCGPDRARVRAEANERIAATRESLAQIMEARRLERIWTGKNSRRPARASASATIREQRQESDSDVAVNLTPEQLIVWEKVKSRIKSGPRITRTEAFLHWVHDHSAEVARIHAADAEQHYRAAVRDEARQRKQLEQLPKGGAKLQAFVAEGLETLGVGAVPALDLPAFAARVQQLAYHDPRVARFHDDRAFLASVYDAGAPWSEGLEPWKRRAVDAHRAGLLRLTRADLVGAMDPELVQRSEATYLGSSFHFVALDQAVEKHVSRKHVARAAGRTVAPDGQSYAVDWGRGSQHFPDLESAQDVARARSGEGDRVTILLGPVGKRGKRMEQWADGKRTTTQAILEPTDRAWATHLLKLAKSPHVFKVAGAAVLRSLWRELPRDPQLPWMSWEAFGHALDHAAHAGYLHFEPFHGPKPPRQHAYWDDWKASRVQERNIDSALLRLAKGPSSPPAPPKVPKGKVRVGAPYTRKEGAGELVGLGAIVQSQERLINERGEQHSTGADVTIIKLDPLTVQDAKGRVFLANPDRVIFTGRHGPVPLARRGQLTNTRRRDYVKGLRMTAKQLGALRKLEAGQRLGVNAFGKQWGKMQAAGYIDANDWHDVKLTEKARHFLYELGEAAPPSDSEPPAPF